MDDLISKQAAIDALEREKSLVERPITETRWFDLGLRKAQDVLSELPSAQSEQRWISVSERLPEFDTKVLAWVENKDPKGRFNSPGIYTATLHDRIPQHDPEGKRNIWGIPGYDSEWTVGSWSYFTEPDVKAWMPLPEPYKEE